jgi:sulfite reductase alpha subunit-like flavoprotein
MASLTTPFDSYRIVYATQSGRAKACARRTARILRECTHLSSTNGSGCTWDEDVIRIGGGSVTTYAEQIRQQRTLLLLFVSTTGDGEQTDTIRHTWMQLLQRSLPSDLFCDVSFALFCLGDRAYGPQFCAAGRKVAVRLLQLGAKSWTEVGYGDDMRSGGGVWADLDDWIHDHLLPSLESYNGVNGASNNVQPEESDTNVIESPYQVEIIDDNMVSNDAEECQKPEFQRHYKPFFQHLAPRTAYSYDTDLNRIRDKQNNQCSLLLAKTIENKHLTPTEWTQETRHLSLQTACVFGETTSNRPYAWSLDALPYQAGDVAAVLPKNTNEEVKRFLNVLPQTIQVVADKVLAITFTNNEKATLGIAYPHWPHQCTLRGWLTYAADIHALPEREDLRALSALCSLSHEHGAAQAERLVHMSETKGSALYVEYILREKRSWADVLYDFDSLRSPDSRLTLHVLLSLLSPLRPREFSIASSPREQLLMAQDAPTVGFGIDFCIAVVQGKTPLGRFYHGLCSHYVSRLDTDSWVRLWIRPGTFDKLPLASPVSIESPLLPVLYIAAGTGIAPIRGLIRERQASQSLTKAPTSALNSINNDIVACTNNWDQCDILLFGCRKEAIDFYYRDEWHDLVRQNMLGLVTAFSQDQWHKIYVQQKLREMDESGSGWIQQHILARQGSIYIAGGPKMARAVQQEIVEAIIR